MSRLYPLALESFGLAQINLLTDSIRMLAVKSSYVYSSSHQYLSDVLVGHRVGSPSNPFTGKTTNQPAPGVFDANDLTGTTGISVPAAAPVITAFIIYQDTGDETTSRLIAIEDGTIVVTAGCGALAGATSVNVVALIASLPLNTSMTFTDGAVATLTAPAAQGDVSIAVVALGLPIVAGETAFANTGTGIPLTPSANGGTIPVHFDNNAYRVFRW